MLRYSLLQTSRRIISLVLIVALAFSPTFSYARSVFVSTLPEPGTMVMTSDAFVPVLVKGLVIHPDKPLNFDFIVDSGNDLPDQAVVEDQTKKMAQYFLAAITVPEDQLWVNLSPYERDRVIESELGQTVLGRDMLAQDYMLKQLTSSLIYPEQDFGKEFWAKVYAEAQAKFGTTDIQVDTFNKVWIMPEKAEVFEKGNAVYVTEARLKVMLDSDRAAAEINAVVDAKAEVAKQVLREVVLPAIEKEVNEGKNFAAIRQVYHAAILAKWYRELIQNTLLSDAYVGKNRVAGLTTDEKALKEEIYQRYISAYTKGVFNYIKEEVSFMTGEMTPRKYFSGGIEDFAMKNLPLARTTDAAAISHPVGKVFQVDMAMGKMVDDGAQAERPAPPALTESRLNQISDIKLIMDWLSEQEALPAGYDLLWLMGSRFARPAMEAAKLWHASQEGEKPKILVTGGVGGVTATINYEKREYGLTDKAIKEVDKILDNLSPQEIMKKFHITRGEDMRKHKAGETVNDDIVKDWIRFYKKNLPAADIAKIIDYDADKRQFKRGEQVITEAEAYAPDAEYIEDVVIRCLKDKNTRYDTIIPEGLVYYAILLSEGVSEDAILVDGQSTNSVENIVNGEKIIEKEGARFKKVVLVQEPYIQRRAKASFTRFMEDKYGKGKSPYQVFSWAAYQYEELNAPASLSFSQFEFFRVKACEEIEKLRQYPKTGKTVHVDVPPEILASAQSLKQAINIDAALTKLTDEEQKKSESVPEDKRTLDFGNKKVLVVGASGFVGKHLMKRLSAQQNVTVIDTSRSHADLNRRLDAANEDSIKDVLDRYKPDAVIFMAGVTDTKFAEENPQQALDVNSRSIRAFKKYFSGHFVYISTDYIFDGNKDEYAVSDIPVPLNAYGASKLAGEEETEGFKDYTIIRSGMMFGDGTTDARKSFVEDIVAKIDRQEEIALDDTQIRQPFSVNNLIRALARVIKNEEFGIKQINGNTQLTKFKLAELILKIYKEEASKLSTGTERQYPNIVPVYAPLKIKAPLKTRMENSFEVAEIEAELREAIVNSSAYLKKLKADIALYERLLKDHYGNNTGDLDEAIRGYQKEYAAEYAKRGEIKTIPTKEEILMEEFLLVTNSNGEYMDNGKGQFKVAPRKLIHLTGLWHRVVHAIILDRQGNMLFQFRARQKDGQPGAIDVASAGHLGMESPEIGIKREIEEEVFNKTHKIDPARLIRIMPEGEYMKDEADVQNSTFFVYIINDDEKPKIKPQDIEVGGFIWKSEAETRALLDEYQKDYRPLPTQAKKLYDKVKWEKIVSKEDAGKEEYDGTIKTPTNAGEVRLTKELSEEEARRAKEWGLSAEKNSFASGFYFFNDDAEPQKLIARLIGNPEEIERFLEKAKMADMIVKQFGGLFRLDPKTGRIYYENMQYKFAINSDLRIVRHGESNINLLVAERYAELKKDEEIDQLTETGLAQAKVVAPHVYQIIENADREVVVFSSALKRAKQTADELREYALSKGKNIEIKELPLINELRTDIEGYRDFAYRSDNEDSPRAHYDATLKIPNGESFIDLLLRAKVFIEHINKNYKGKTVIIYSHGLFINALSILQGDERFVTKEGCLALHRAGPKNTEIMKFGQSEMTIEPEIDTAPGGIDIQNIDVQRKNGSAKIQFNDEAVRNVLKNGFNGFTPVIINITPIESPMMIMDASQPETQSVHT